ncbi:MAG: glycosyltransferase family 4 protein [Candidatus ainarchaeum sp.]|nr:glycosyltransferase family 4 protein [Candidatus ainarchaeum sp.]
MKICMIIEDYPPNCGGGGIAVYEISKRLAKNHEVTVVTCARKNRPQKYSEEGVNVIRLGSNRLSFFFLVLKHLLSEQSLDVYHAHGTFCGLIAKLVSSIKKKPVILHLHGYRPKSFSAIKYYLQNFIIKLGFDRIISADKYALMEVEKIGVNKNKLYEIKFGVDTELFRPKKIKRTLALLFVGRLVKVKGIDLLLDAVKQLKPGEIELWIIGDGELETKLKALAAEHEINAKFFNSVPREKLVDYYASAKFLVLPSFSEGQGLVLYESLASGTPIIVSDIPSLKETAESCGAGFIFRKGDAFDLTTVIRNCISINEIEYKKLSENARKFAEGFSWERTARDLEKIYRVIPDA